MSHEIYVFVNGGLPGWYNVTALCECGEFLGGHCCSHPAFGPHDLGVHGSRGEDIEMPHACSETCRAWHHDTYRKHAPTFSVIWVDDWRDPRIEAAHRKHCEKYPAQPQGDPPKEGT